MGVYAQSAQNTTKLLHLHPVKITEVQNSQDTDHKAALHFVDRYIHGNHAGEIDLTLVQISNEAWFHISIYVNSLNNMIPILIYKVSLHKVEVHIPYYERRETQTETERETMGPIIFSKTKNSHSPTPFFEHCQITRKPVTFFSKTVQHLTIQTILCVCLWGVYTNIITRRVLWPPHSPYGNPCF